jgi:MarR family transcriptional repressor of emrRAB
MLSLKCYETRLGEMSRRYPEMPSMAVMVVRLALFLQRRLDDRLTDHLARHGLSHSAWSLLMLIHSSPGGSIAPSEASSVLRQSRPHMTRMTDELVERGWVERHTDPKDRRAISISITPLGQQELERLLPTMWREYEDLTAGFSGEEMTQLHGLLRGWLLHLEGSRESNQSNQNREEQ